MSNSVIFLLIFICIIGIIALKALANRYAIIKVRGNSMYPTFKDGEILLLKKKFVLIEGRVYVFTSPLEQKYLIKRLVKINIAPVNGRMNLYFLGDNELDSSDSRDFGYVPTSSVKGEATKLFGGEK